MIVFFIIVLILTGIVTASFVYLFAQWLVFPKSRGRFRTCQPYLMIGCALTLIGAPVLRQLGRAENSDGLRELGGAVALIGSALTVYAAVRLLQFNAAGRRVAKVPLFAPITEGVWPPPPDNPDTV